VLGFSGIIVGNKIDIANWKSTAPFYKIIEESGKKFPHFFSFLLTRITTFRF